MAVAMMVDNPEGSQEVYEQIRAHIGLDKPAGGDLPHRRPEPERGLARDRGVGVGGGGAALLPGAVHSRAASARHRRPAAAARVLARPQRDAVGEAEMEAEYYETIVIGGGQAGLTAGYYLARQGREFLILDGERQRRRRLAQAVGLAAALHAREVQPAARACASPGVRVVVRDEGRDGRLPRGVRRRFELPVRTGVTVDGLTKVDGWFVVSAGDRRFEAKNVIVATGAHRIPKRPGLRVGARSRGSCRCTPRSTAAPSQLAGGRRARRRRGQLRRRDRIRARRIRIRVCWPGRAPVRSPCRHGSLPFRARAFACSGSSMHRIVRVDTRIGRKLGRSSRAAAPR